MIRLATITMLALCGSAIVGAQTLDRGQIRGTVYDASRSAVPQAQVTLSNDATGFKRVTQSNEAGAYQFAQIPPGTYQIIVEFTGFATTTITEVQVSVGSSLTLDPVLQLAGQQETVTVAAAAGVVDAVTTGISQLINQENLENLPLSGRDYRDLAQLSPSAQVVPGLRGGIRLGGQQSDYTGLAIDGGDAYNNVFGEFFGSLETKNFTIPLDAVQEFQVVTNGFAPEFGRSTGGLLNVVTKSGTNVVEGTAHLFYRGKNLTADDALGTPPSIDSQQQFGGAIGFPVVRDRQFLFFAADRQLQDGPLVTRFARSVSGIAVPELGIANLSTLEGPHTQSQNLFSVLGRWDYRSSQNQSISVRSFFTRNATNGFTGGRGQNQVSNSFDNTEQFKNQGANTVVSWNRVAGNKVNELKGLFSYETRPRQPNGTDPETQINDTGTFGQRFFLPINGDAGKIQIQDNFVYVFGKHDMKLGADVNTFFDHKGVFAGWSRGTYVFNTLEDFQARRPIGFIQGFGLGGRDVFEAGSNEHPARQTGIGLYWQDKWQTTTRLTVTYGLRYDITINPEPQSGTPGQRVYTGVGSDSQLIAPPQKPPNDYKQFGPRVGVAYTIPSNTHAVVIRGAWGLYYAQTPTIFLPGGSGRGATLFCFFNPACQPPGGYPTLFPSSLQSGDPLFASLGNPGISYVDPEFRNPRVSNLTTGVEYQLSTNWSTSINYAYSHSDFLRTGGFSSTQWERNVVVDHVDEFGRSILRPSPIFGPLRQDQTIGSAQALGSFSRGNYHQIALNVTRRLANRYQLFANYSWSQNKDNASSERDSETFFGPQDPFDIELDYGRNGLDIPHQFKVAAVAEVPYGFILSGLVVARSGLPYPAYILDDINGDGVSNQGFGSNDRPVVTRGGERFLLERYPARQPSFFQVDFRVSRRFGLREKLNFEVLAELFNLFNNENLFSNPNNSAFVNTALTDIPRPGDVGPTGARYRTLDQISPGSSPFAVQLGVRFNF